MLPSQNPADFVSSSRLTAEEMDDLRQKNIAYQYLCHLEEAKKWIEACIQEELPEINTLEEEFRHGVFLAKLANFFAPNLVPSKKIYDTDLIRYRRGGLGFRHTDNINYFLKAVQSCGLPKIFYPDTTDIYNKKNIPKLVFCIHALSLYLFKLGVAPQIQNLYGKIQFSDEVMTTMMEELNKFGCQMPQFGKIGGILASELPVDEASLHAAIIAINDAIQKKDQKELESTLTNPSCYLKNVEIKNISNYCSFLCEAQDEKRAMAQNKSHNESYIPDAYDELLSKSEIQDFIDHVNGACAIGEIEKAIKIQDQNALWNSLTSKYLSLKGLKEEFISKYMTFLAEEIKKDPSENSLWKSEECVLGSFLHRSTIQKLVNEANARGEELNTEKRLLKNLMKSLQGGTEFDTLRALKAMMPAELVLDFAAPIYHKEMEIFISEYQNGLDISNVENALKFLTAIGDVNIALETGNVDEIWESLNNPLANFESLDASSYGHYISKLINDKASKATANEKCPLLTFDDIQIAIDEVNADAFRENKKVSALHKVNSLVQSRDYQQLLQVLKEDPLKVNTITQDNALHFIDTLNILKHNKSQLMKGTDVELWLEDLIEASNVVKAQEEEAINFAHFLAALNDAIRTRDLELATKTLRSYKINGFHIRQDLLHQVSCALFDLYHEEYLDPVIDPWVTYNFPDGSSIYINPDSRECRWKCPRGITLDLPDAKLRSRYIGIEEIEAVIQDTSELSEVNQKLEESVIKLQASCRGYLMRQKIKKWNAKASVIQSWWRMVRVRRSYLMYQNALKFWEPQIIKIQRAYRSWIQKKRNRAALEKFSKMESKIVTIQRAWRQYKARVDLQALTHCKNPSLGVIRRFVYLLQVSHFDMEEELRLQRVKSDVVKTIRRSQELESQIDEYDIKIGLLVQNRITLQDVIRSASDKENINPNKSSSSLSSKKNKMNGKGFERVGTIKLQKGLKALTKESRERLSGYQHLFYLLQTQPHYLASLIFALPMGKTTNFIENVIFTLYNYGANDRDNYLLLRLLKTALEEEIRSKVLRLSDIATGNPLVIKMIVSFNRKGTGQSALRDMLGPLVNEVLADPHLQINTNPVEIYKTWVNQLEMNTGEPSGLPYIVTCEEALQYPEVQKRLMKAINVLKEASDLFCKHITNSRHLIPYAMQYMAKVMKAALHKRFPHIPEKEILKAVGNLVYYRYINSAIVAPDAFDIVQVSLDKKLSNEQRRNLASISKILQFAASKKGFGEEASHLMGLNPFIIECHEKFKLFFKECCMVDDPEVVYNMNQYTEATIIVKPTVYITLQEMIQTHELLLDHEGVIAPDPKDSLHELLRDLGERPTIFNLVGDAQVENAGPVSLLGRTEVCLSLSSKFDIPEGFESQKDKDSNKKLFNKSKQLLVDLMQCVEGDSIHSLTICPSSAMQEEKYLVIVNTRLENEQKAKLNNTDLNISNAFIGDTNRCSLTEVKTKLNHNLRRLENRNLATRSDNYQSLLNSIASDIVDQRQHRINRRSELQKLVTTLKKLEEKENFYKDQLQSYMAYHDTCLGNLPSRTKNVHRQVLSVKAGKSSKNKLAIKYTGSRLHERGIILEIEDLPPAQMKNVLFEITPLATTGVFQVQVKFMGVAMEVVQLDIQELLQLQFEGISVKTMFGKAKVNVNLLLHLLNSKFYSKKK